tara:strand:+ start:94240 stop:94989 length:750 start_codon:yes stop_codon:yes gene_type:complete
VKKVIFLASIFISYSIFSAGLVFSFNKVVEYDEFKTSSTFVLLDNGRFSFKTSTGGFHLCSGERVGEFNGQLNNDDYKKLLADFLKVEKSCAEIDSCDSDSKKRSSDSFDWSIFGWGKYSKKKYFFTGGTQRPQLFDTIFKLEKKFYQNPEVSLKLTKIKETKKEVKLHLHYLGKKSIDVIKNEGMFVKVDKNSQTRLIGKSSGVKNLKNDDSIYFSFDKEKYKLEKGDYLVYSPPSKNNLNPCIVISN